MGRQRLMTIGRGIVAGVVFCVVASTGVAQRSASRVTDPRPGVAAGALEEHVLYDSSYKRRRRIWVYTPPGYDARRVTLYPLIAAFDGDEYRDTMPLPMILDTLLAAKAAPAFVAVLVDDSSSAVRIADLGNSARMVSFLAKQLVPWVRSKWHVTTDPRRVIVTGSSAGGLGATYVAFMRPAEQVKRWAKRDLRFYLDVGEMEDHPTLGGAGPNFRDASRRFRDALGAKGYDVTYSEVPGGNHGERWWRLRLPAGIVALSAGWPRD